MFSKTPLKGKKISFHRRGLQVDTSSAEEATLLCGITVQFSPELYLRDDRSLLVSQKPLLDIYCFFFVGFVQSLFNLLCYVI